ncbi:CRISPR-associated endonuclease Cas1 [Vacuolonema iberomarrocanum]|uniref:CRISPR-associated endonuclease Cas1 n=1 Tax=Vacuolonema iberomarrocanum TaxID=3454632 RepID=UPI0019D8F0E1|nr:CRISPR-associated endonuclease Cas1 [filamentous cyanobacterium LEGE 07170]
MLFQRFIDPDNFERAWDKVATNRGCAGVDGETIAAFGWRKRTALPNLRQAVATGRYRPMPLRQFWIPKKADGNITGWRALRVPTVRDRIVQQALLQVLYPVMEAEFDPASYAYRPGRSHRMAVEKVNYWRSRGYDWVLDADIVKYFDRIQHERLLEEVQERINRPWLLHLIEGWITAGSLTPQGILLPQRGVPQGAVISPLLANVYLDDFDAELRARHWKLVRYADDFVVLGRSRQQVEQGRDRVAQLLQEMALQLHPEKTRITSFDQGFRFLGHVFAGELVLPLSPVPKAEPVPPGAKASSDLQLVYADTPDSPTAMQQALVAALKQSEQPIPPPLFVVLGYKVRPQTPVEITSQEIEWRNGMSSLYVVEQGTYLQKEQGRFILKAPKDDALEVPIQEVERILVFGNVQLSTAVIASCLGRHIPVIFLSQLGEYKGHLWSAEITDLVAEAQQFDRQTDEPFRCRTARAIVYGKLWNSKLLLMRQNRKRALPSVNKAITRLDDALTTLSNAERLLSLEQLRGYEGNGASHYFQTFPDLITHPDFPWQGRIFHPPTDPVNSLLSFGYTLLFNNVFSLLLAEGLNPYLGNLHRAERQKAYLAFDLMEEFRSPVVDSLVLRLINQKIVRPTDFTWPKENQGVYLTNPARRVFLKHFEQRMTATLTHPDVKEPVSYRRVIHLQVQRYKRAVLGQVPYEAFQRPR